MLKLFKMLTGAFVLATLALPVVAQQFPTARDAAPTVAGKAVVKPKYLVAYGRVLARIDQRGLTKFNWQNGKLVSEVLPSGVIGTYQYDAGKFSGITYTDGRYINIAYHPDGKIAGLTTNTAARVKFNVTSKMTPKRSFVTIQNGIGALENLTEGPGGSNCTGTDDDSTCTIIIQGGGGGGGDDPWADGYDPTGYSGEGEGAIHNPPGETPEQCIANVCRPATDTFLQYCEIATNSPTSHLACINKVKEYKQRCQTSCVTNDWSWLDWWLFFF